MEKKTYIITGESPNTDFTVTEIGAKAYQLHLLERNGFPVPVWFAISSAAFEETIAPMTENLNEILNSIDNIDAVLPASRQIVKILAPLKINDSLQAQLRATITGQFGNSARLAVRSSAADEDSPLHSFAGQFESHLNVIPEQVASRVLDIWRSAFSARVLAYRWKKGILLQPTRMAVIVQKMISPRASGVAFTRNPENGKKEISIEAAYGLGEGVVADRAETDSYRIGWHAFTAKRCLRTKSQYISLADGDAGGTRQQTLPDSLRHKPVLSSREIRQLRRQAVRLERCFGAPQDIEWAIDNSRRIYILQSRPVTSLRRPECPETICLWDNSNIVESYPGLTLPLTFSFIQCNYETLFRAASCGLVISRNKMAQRDDIWQNMIGLIRGRVYYNLKNWYAMLSFLPGCYKHKKSWDAMIGISRSTAMKPGRLRWYDRIFALCRIIIFLSAPRRLERRFHQRFAPLHERYRAARLEEMTNHQLLAHFRKMQSELHRFWHLSLYVDFCAMKYFDWLKSLCRRWVKSGNPNLHSDLLCGEPETESVKAVRSLVALAEIIRHDPVYRSLFSDHNAATVWQKILQDEPLLPLRRLCLKHLQLYGDRVAEELKLETATPRQNPELLINTVQDYINTELTVSGLIEQETARRRSAENQLFSNLRNPFKRFLVRQILARARFSVAGRENLRFARTRAYGIAREIFHLLAKRLTEINAISCPEDIGYLTLPEIFGYIQGTSVNADLIRLVEIRRAEYKLFAAQNLPSHFETGLPPALYIPTVTTCPGNGDHRLVGTACSSGIADGTAVVMHHLDRSAVGPNQIIVAESTDPSWVLLMIRAAGLIVERGSILSHTAIVGRELGIPTIVGVEGATHLIPDRSHVSMDGATGEVVWN